MEHLYQHSKKLILLYYYQRLLKFVVPFLYMFWFYGIIGNYKPNDEGVWGSLLALAIFGIMISSVIGTFTASCLVVISLPTVYSFRRHVLKSGFLLEAMYYDDIQNKLLLKLYKEPQEELTVEPSQCVLRYARARSTLTRSNSNPYLLLEYNNREILIHVILLPFFKKKAKILCLRLQEIGIGIDKSCEKIMK